MPYLCSQECTYDHSLWYRNKDALYYTKILKQIGISNSKRNALRNVIGMGNLWFCVCVCVMGWKARWVTEDTHVKFYILQNNHIM